MRGWGEGLTLCKNILLWGLQSVIVGSGRGEVAT